MDSNDFVSTEEVVAEASEQLNDSDFTHGVGKSLYELYAHRTVESLALNMFFQKVTKDIFNWNKCGTGLMEIPKNCFNVKEIYLFNSSCDAERDCVPTEATTVTAGNSYTLNVSIVGAPTLVSLTANSQIYPVGFVMDGGNPDVVSELTAILNGLGLGSIFTVQKMPDTSLTISTGCTLYSLNNIIILSVATAVVLFSGTSCGSTTIPATVCEDDNDCGCCSSRSCWTSFVEAHWKRMFNKFGSTGIKTAKIAPGHSDPVYLRTSGYSDTSFPTSFPSGNLVYFGIQGGDIAFSDNATCYANVRIVANGFGSDNCELPIIPRPLRAVCVDKVKVMACEKMMLYYDEYKLMYQIYKGNLLGDNSVQNPGTWLQAERYVKSLNSKQRNDLFEYFGNIDIK